MLNSLLRLLRWMCFHPIEACEVLVKLLHACWRAAKSGGTVIVLCRAGGIGDVLWAAAAAGGWARSHPKDVVLFLTQHSMVEAVHLAEPALVVLKPGLPDSILIAVLRRWFVVKPMEYQSFDHGGQHLWHSYLKSLNLSFSVTSFPESWNFPRKHDARASSPMACIYAGPSWRVRELPLNLWEEVVQRLHDDLGLRVLQIMPAGVEQRNIAGVDEHVVGESLPALCNLFDQSHVVITIDSVMLHLAAGTRAAIIGLFGPTSVASRLFTNATRLGLHTLLPCQGCHHLEPRLHWESGCPHDVACMKQISVSDIMDAARKVIAAKS